MSSEIRDEEIVLRTKELIDVDDELKSLLKQKAFNLLKEKFNNENQGMLNEKIMVKFIILTMELVEETKVKGKTQKDLVIYIVSEVIKESPLTGEEKEVLRKILYSENTRDTIELVVDASKGKLNLNKVKKVGIEWLICCLKKV